MKNKVLKITEIILIVVIVLVCSISLLHNETIFGYRSYFITSDNNNFLKGDLILVKKISNDEITNKDIIVYNNGNDEVITSKVLEVQKEEQKKIIKVEDDKIISGKQIYGKYQYKFIILGVISRIITNKIGFVLCVSIPFIVIIILELLNVFKENKRKNIENSLKEQLDIISDIEDDSKLKEVLEKNIEEKLEKINNSNNDIKKIKKIEQTIQIPLLEIQEQIQELTKEEKDLEDTIILFNTEDIKKEIEKELSTKTVDKETKKDRKSTKAVEKSQLKEHISTESVEK